MSRAVRVLVVDDSALMRKLIPQLLTSEAGIEVVGTAMDGNFALKKIEELKPQVITLDLEMPGLNGIDALKEIVRRWRLPVIVVSSHSTSGAAITLKALALGAFDFVAKPADTSTRMGDIARELIGKIRAAAQVQNVRPRSTPEPTPAAKPLGHQPSAPTRIVAIGISTGGPQALEFLFSQLPAEFPGSILVVQHMPEAFTEMFARRLDEISPIRVKEAQSGDLLLAGRVLIAPGNRHLRAKRLPLGNVAVLGEDAPVHGHRPSVDVLFHSIAEEFGPQSIAIQMTGMGEDGAAGMCAVKRAGGLTLAQGEQSCVVFGMPKAAIDRGYVSRIVELEALPATLQAQCAAERQARGTTRGR
jgi:two-component system, chemotaxis family, protein-glutamate methylesterase/glutaminase